MDNFGVHLVTLGRRLFSSSSRLLHSIQIIYLLGVNHSQSTLQQIRSWSAEIDGFTMFQNACTITCGAVCQSTTQKRTHDHSRVKHSWNWWNLASHKKIVEYWDRFYIQASFQWWLSCAFSRHSAVTKWTYHNSNQQKQAIKHHQATTSLLRFPQSHRGSPSSHGSCLIVTSWDDLAFLPISGHLHWWGKARAFSPSSGGSEERSLNRDRSQDAAPETFWSCWPKIGTMRLGTFLQAIPHDL